ncbi:MlaD family protein [Nocardioides sp.]|uniref:MCE family protein n=1 Tax=Nocardioides sp. TaxID=35761 RepID=UPI00260B1BA1|nr:MlaD family protein [Nocardioides sp.]
MFGLDGFRLTLVKSIVFIVATALATLALAGTIRNSASGNSHTYTAMFTDVTSLHTGDDVRMAGVKVGTVDKISVSEDPAAGDVARVRFTVTDSTPMTQGTTAQLRFRNLVGQRYLSLAPPTTPGTTLPANYVFSTDQTTPALDLTALFNGFQPLFRLLNPDDVNTLSSQIIAVFQGEGPTVDDLVSSAASLTSTLADRDQVIGNLITDLNSVLTVVNQRSGQLDTTIVTLQKLVTGLSQDRATIGQSISGLGNLTTSVSDLLTKGRAPLKKSISSLGDLSANLAGSSTELNSFLEKLPTKLETIGRVASYGSWLNFYVCSIQGRIPLPEGYMGDLGVNPIDKRCR